MKVLRIAVSVIFVLTTVVFGYFQITEIMKKDDTIPQITIEEEILEVELTATNDDLLKGVTAYDEKDKDLTDKVVVESISKFIEPGLCKVTYAVCDSDNHVAVATRKIRYRGYTSPKIYLTDSLCYSVYEKRLNLADVIKAEDCIEGDISSDINILSEDYTSSIEGVFEIQATVTNSKGDTSTITIPLIVDDISSSAPEIELKEYLVYAKKNQKIDFESYIVSAKDSRENDLTDEVTFETNIDVSKEGTYTVHYSVTDEKDVEGITVLTVIIGD